jgi:hypothetical protein
LPRITQLKDKTEVDAGQSIFITTLNDIENKVSEDEHKTTATLNYNPKNGILTKSCVERGCFQIQKESIAKDLQEQETVHSYSL